MRRLAERGGVGGAEYFRFEFFLSRVCEDAGRDSKGEFMSWLT